MGTQLKYRFGALSAVTLVLVVLATTVGSAPASQVLQNPGIVAATGPTNNVLGYVDIDKLNLGTLTNFYDDLNSNSEHDVGEPFAATAQGGWTNPQSRSDMSCWLASACNMLEQLGKVADGQALYMDYALNGVPSPGGTLTWDEGGLQEYAIQHWMNQNPGSGVTMQVHWPNQTWVWTDAMYAWDWDPRTGTDDYLAAGWEVGIGMWPLVTSDGINFEHLGGHALTIQAINAGSTFDCTDSDRDGDWSGPGDLNSYTDATRVGAAPDSTILYAWYNDFYDGDIGVYPVGDVGYVCAIIPEPATMTLLALGALGLLRRRCK